MVVVAVVVLCAATGWRCYLDVLNAAISRCTTFEPYYAGVPGKPAVKKYCRELGELDARWEEVRDEMERVLAAKRGRIPTMKDAYDNMFVYKGSEAAKPAGVLARKAEAASQLAAKLVYGRDTEIFDRIGTPDWTTYNLILFGQDVPGNASACPVTVELLRRVPRMQSALFSIIAPGAYIPPHKDPAKGVIRYHLALRVPADRERCFISVDGVRYHWQEGRSVVFDDVFEHWVRNDTDEERVILFVDILRPLTGPAKVLQSAANFANRHNPGVRRLIAASSVR
jgi:hypothetical protein